MKLARMNVKQLDTIKYNLEQKKKVTVKSKPKNKNRKPLERTYYVDHIGSKYYKHVVETLNEKLRKKREFLAIWTKPNVSTTSPSMARRMEGR